MLFTVETQWRKPLTTGAISGPFARRTKTVRIFRTSNLQRYDKINQIVELFLSNLLYIMSWSWLSKGLRPTFWLWQNCNQQMITYGDLNHEEVYIGLSPFIY